MPPAGAGLEPFLPQPPLPDPAVILPDGVRVPLPASARRTIEFKPRYAKRLNFLIEDQNPEKTLKRVILTDGVIVNVVHFPATGGPPEEIEFATDSVVAWLRNVGGVGGGPIETSADGRDGQEIELFLSGDVVIRTLADGQTGPVDQVLRAERIYYDVTHNRAVAIGGDLEMRTPGGLDTVHLRGDRVWRLGKNEWRIFGAETSSSKRPSDPNLTLTTREATFTQQRAVRTNIFGIPYRDPVTGQPEVGYERTLDTGFSFLRIFDVPVIPFFPSKTDIDDPFGPLVGIGGGNDQIFGVQVYTTFDMYKLIARRPPPGHRWRLDVDYLSDRGPALGTNYNYIGPDFLGLGNQHAGFVRLYGIQDNGVDQIGGGRAPILDPSYRGKIREFNADGTPVYTGHPEYRGRAQLQHNQDLYEYGTTFARVTGQVSYLSDPNFLEQYYKQEFDMGMNQDTFLHLFGASENWYGSVLLQDQLNQDWWTVTEWLPKVDGAVVGETFLQDRLVYTAEASAGYAQLRPAVVPPLPLLVSNAVPVDTGRFDINQKVSAPFDLGPVRVNPYGLLDLTYYSENAVGQDDSRVYGGGGVSLSLTASRLYREAHSEMFNVRGLYHKATFTADYSSVRSDTPFYNLPQLDPLFDNAVDQGFRNARPTPGIAYPPEAQPGFAYPDLGYAPSILFNPQSYAIRRQVGHLVDTRDDLDVLRLDNRHRLQTKRGFPGSEHTVDWMTLNTGISLFPNADRDNFGSDWAFFDYYYLWHLGDRFSVTTSGWIDPFDDGAQYYSGGVMFNRPDGTNVYLGYRHTDPLQSRAVTTSINYQLSRRYAMNIGSSYDFGLNESLTNTLSFSRTGPDVTMLFGVTYNPLVNNFGFQFSLIPNIAGLSPTGGFGSAATMLAGR